MAETKLGAKENLGSLDSLHFSVALEQVLVLYATVSYPSWSLMFVQPFGDL